MLKELLEEALRNMFHETEVHYNIKLLKNKTLDIEELDFMYKKALDTLEVLMIKLGLGNVFQKVKNEYE
jgi:hypothetical protein